MTIREFAPAKINLALHVTGQRADGFHLLDSIVCFASLGDWITVEKADALSLDVAGPFGLAVPQGAENLAIKAAQLIAPGRGVKITLEKNLPVASGIGGGSSDAAAAVRAMAQLFDLPHPNLNELISLGADIPVCFHGGVVRMTGIGDEVSSVAGFPGFFGVLVNPNVAISTPTIFAALPDKNNAPMDAPPLTGDWVSYLQAQRNDLQVPAIKSAPIIQDVISQLDNYEGCLLARMSGSGATCFGLFENQRLADAAVVALAEVHPNWWVQSVRFGASGGDTFE